MAFAISGLLFFLACEDDKDETALAMAFLIRSCQSVKYPAPSFP